jgi:CYTH domain-containing protein
MFYMPAEIERKFIINEIPSDITFSNLRQIYQTYMVIGDEEIRIRQIIEESGKEKYSMTLKKGSGLKRDEFKWTINASTYNKLFAITDASPLIKYRKDFKFKGTVYEMDEIMNTEHGIIRIVEIEFPSVKKAKSFKVPSWFGEEVTEKVEFSNQALWKRIQELEHPEKTEKTPVVPSDKDIIQDFISDLHGGIFTFDTFEEDVAKKYPFISASLKSQHSSPYNWILPTSEGNFFIYYDYLSTQKFIVTSSTKINIRNYLKKD